MEHALHAQLPAATIIASAPGRVNLIGEHTDYNGFPVLPLAIDRHVWIAAAPLREPILRIRSIDPARYPGEEIALADLRTRTRRGSWTDYVVAAARCRTPTRGIELLVAGDIPPEAGLSSSSALVVASFLALGEPGERTALAEQARRAERYVGTLSGGMDHAISLLARRGHALRIDFRPLRTQAVPVPESLGIVVAHSGVRAAKSGTAREGYNARVRECLEAARQMGAAENGLLADVPGRNRAALTVRLEDPLLRQRARFVFQEARRVEAAVDALRRADLVALGELLNASHAGLRDDYQVSHPAVDALVSRALAGGADGARVLGAGFGGCIVAVCERDRAAALVASLGEQAWVFAPSGPALRRSVHSGPPAFTEPAG